jgi:glycosyltransferase involved in cell wall biosynthesis
VKIAIVHDWLVTDGGAEKVLRSLVELYPRADLYALVDFLSAAQREKILGGRDVRTSFIQRLPFARKHFRNYLPLFPMAIESFDLSGYDLILSSSWAVAKGVKRVPGQKHICYCHTPIRYAWDLYKEYTEGLPPVKRRAVEWTLKRLRRWDLDTLGRVDRFIANSRFVAERIRRTYGRKAEVIYPPVDTSAFTLCREKEEYYLTASRLVPYKKTRLVVEAFNAMPERRLIVVGDGEEYDAIHRIAGPNVEVAGYLENGELIEKMRRAKAFVYGAVEDFGIVPVEALACGTPVIALGKGGTAETVRDGVNGVLFGDQEAGSIVEAVERFEKMVFDPERVRENSRRFSTARFKREIVDFVMMATGEER